MTIDYWPMIADLRTGRPYALFTLGNQTVPCPQVAECGHCGQWHVVGGICPRVKAIDYHPDGAVKRVEYHDAAPPLPG